MSNSGIGKCMIVEQVKLVQNTFPVLLLLKCTFGEIWFFVLFCFSSKNLIEIRFVYIKMFKWTVLTTPWFISYFWLISILYSDVCFCRCCIVNSLILWDIIDMVWHKMKHFRSSESQAFLIFHFAEQFKIPTSASLIWSRSKFWTTGISLRWKFISSNPCGRMSACGVRASFVYLSVLAMINIPRESQSVFKFSSPLSAVTKVYFWLITAQ